MNNLIVRNGNRPLSVFDDLDRVMDAFFGDTQFGIGRVGYRVPAIDVAEEDNQYVLNADIPGLSEKDIQIKVDEQLLTISSTVERKKEEKKDGWLVRERAGSSFSRSFTLPKDVDAAAIEAKVSDGVLTVVLPKQPKAQPKVIDIKKG